MKKGIWKGRISELILSIVSGLFRCFMVSVCVAKRQKEVGIYASNRKKIGARIYLYKKDALIQKVTYAGEMHTGIYG